MNSLFVPGQQVWLATPVVVDGYQFAARPPGVMSGMSRDTAIRLARNSGALPPE